MQPSTNQDYKQLLTEVIKKQIVILGPDITLSKARNVKGLTVADDGTVTSVDGNSQEVTQALIDQFVQLSGLIVKKTMEPLLSLSQEAPKANQSLETTSMPISQPVTADAHVESTSAPHVVLPPTNPTVQAPTQSAPSTKPANPQTNTNPAPASNPLAA